MASPMATGTKLEKPSFAKIAAAGIKPPNVKQPSNNNSLNLSHHEIISPPQDGSNITPLVADSSDFTTAKAPQKLAQLSAKESDESTSSSTDSPQVHVSGVDQVLHAIEAPAVAEDRLMPSSADEAATQASSSNDSVKPPSLDGKSVTSGTTFALDEKESLRPDDSASVKAADDEDASIGPSGSGLGSDDGIRAFRDQLREINSIDRSRRGGVPASFTPGVAPARGVLYVPPQTSAPVPLVEHSHTPELANGSVDVTPDPKLLEALESPRDRIWVLKLEQDIIDFVKDAKESSLNLPQCNSFYRMLAHKIADYYMLGHLVDDSAAAVRLYKTPSCRIPAPLTGITTPSTAASTPPPTGTQMKILRRGEGPTILNGSNMTSKTGSDAGESGEDDKKPKLPASREEREARYEAARLRIMGSARPADLPEVPKEQDDSRASSTTGKKTKKGRRDNSDDDFEPRTNFNSYFASTTASTGNTPHEAGPFQMPATPQTDLSSSAALNNQAHQPGVAAFQPQAPMAGTWQYPMYGSGDGAQGWAQNYQQPYDMSAEFQRSMSLQQAQYQDGGNVFSPNGGFGNSSYAQQQPWPQQQYPSPYQQVQPQLAYGFPQTYSPRPASSSSQTQPNVPNQPYAYGQLPSQTYPGRPPSKLEHPLPGSYKGQHFNPQSQTFVPGQVNGSVPHPFPLQRTPSNNASFGNVYGGPLPPQRQGVAQAQVSVQNSPQLVNSAQLSGRYPMQQMTHPLPQPVFARQPSPAQPLPPKPQTMPQKLSEHHISSSPPSEPSNGNGQGSSISKWAVPASLPAKPPPSAEPFDAAKLQSQRQASFGSSSSSRAPSGSMPTFGFMPPMAGGVGAAASAGQQSARR